ncbi:hypothetical protein KL920_005443, partial [Ogataea angusta]
VHKGAGWF